MGKKKKQEKGKKQKEKLKKSELTEKKTDGVKKDKAKKKDRKLTVETAAKKQEAKPIGKAVGGSTESVAKGAAGRLAGRPAKGTTGGSAEDKLREMAERFRALGDKNRLQILALLADREICAGDILESMDIVQSTLSHHMKILTEAGIVKCRKQGKWSYYSVDRKLQTELKRLAECGSEKES